MRNFLLLSLFFFLFSCSSDDNSYDDGLCSGKIEAEDVEGNVINRLRLDYDCYYCGKSIPDLIYGIDEISGEEINILNGVFICD